MTLSWKYCHVCGHDFSRDNAVVLSVREGVWKCGCCNATMDQELSNEHCLVCGLQLAKEYAISYCVCKHEGCHRVWHEMLAEKFMKEG